MRFLVPMLLVGWMAGATAFAQSPPEEVHRRIVLASQTHGPPATYSLDQVTLLLSRMSPATHEELGVTYSGLGRTVYVRKVEERGHGEKAVEVSGDELFSLLDEVYRSGFFSLGESYTERISVQLASGDTVTTQLTELKPNPPVVTLTVRIGDYSKSVRALDSREHAEAFGTPAALLDLANFIIERPQVKALIAEVSQ